MKCPYCNAWTEVADTRASDTLIKRNRLCANGHKFPTFEAVAKPAELLAKRNRQAAKRVLAGESQTAVAKAFHMPRSELSRYMSKHHPGFDARGSGQLYRWALHARAHFVQASP